MMGSDDDDDDDGFPTCEAGVCSPVFENTSTNNPAEASMASIPALWESFPRMHAPFWMGNLGGGQHACMLRSERDMR